MMEVILPDEKRDEIVEEAKMILLAGSVSVRQLHRFQGLVQAVRLPVVNARAHSRGVQRLLIDSGVRKLKKIVPLSSWAVQDLVWWTQLRQGSSACFKPVPMWKTIPLGTDSTLTGWGWALHGIMDKGCWPIIEGKQDIAILEFDVLEKALVSNLAMVSNRHVLWRIDNTTAHLYWRNEGGTKNRSLCKRVVKMVQFCELNKITIVTRWISTEENLIPDLLSRHKPLPDWSLDQTTVDRIFAQFGQPQIDLMATNRSKKVHTFYAVDRSDETAADIDALVMDWSVFGLAYLFPPPQILPDCLRKIQFSSRTSKFLIITPYQMMQVWFPVLHSMSLGHVWRLKNPKIIDLTTETTVLGVRWAVWECFGKGEEEPTYRQELGNLSTAAGRREQRERTKDIGMSGYASVNVRDWIQLPIV